VGDAADGFPGIPGWGAKSAATVLARFKHIEAIPDDPKKWRLAAISAGRTVSLAASLAPRRAEAMLYKKLATLRYDVPLKESLGHLEWKGARRELIDLCKSWGDERIAPRVPRWR
jgi:5'-3' exonuclease